MCIYILIYIYIYIYIQIYKDMVYSKTLHGHMDLVMKLNEHSEPRHLDTYGMAIHFPVHEVFKQGGP